MAIIVCGDSIRSSYWYLDCSAVSENILLAAESLGLGAVWTAAYPYEDPHKHGTEIYKYSRKYHSALCYTGRLSEWDAIA